MVHTHQASKRDGARRMATVEALVAKAPVAVVDDLLEWTTALLGPEGPLSCRHDLHQSRDEMIDADRRYVDETHLHGDVCATVPPPSHGRGVDDELTVERGDQHVARVSCGELPSLRRGSQRISDSTVDGIDLRPAGTDGNGEEAIAGDER